MIPRFPSFQFLLAAIATVFISACEVDTGESSAQATARQAFLEKRNATLENFQPCRRTGTTALASLVAESLCTTFQVPENYAAPEARLIDLKVMVIPALSDLPEPDPLVLLAGGPGQAATDLLQVAQVFSRVRTDRDIVLVDQRGTGELSPFDCQMDEEQAAEFEAQDPGFEEVMAAQLQILRDCLDTMAASPQFYTTDIAIQDLDAVRDFLGYSQLNLWGASYGSRAALAYLQAFPATTRALVIDAVAPTAIALPSFSERDASASLEKIFQDCAADTQCKQAFPELVLHYSQLLEKLALPQPVTVINDSDFSAVETTIEDFKFLNILRQVLYSREAQRLIPLIIEQAWQGNYNPLFSLTAQYSENQINQGMFLSVICDEDYPLIDQAALTGSEYLLESSMFNSFVYEACAIWPKRELPASYFDAVTQDKPVLIFSGTLDPITPPQWGELVAAALPDARHFILEGFAHGTPFTQCTATIMNSFIEAGTLEGLDSECVGRFARRPFFLTPGGSSVSND